MTIPKTIADVSPGATDRATFYGQTGCGKTTLARYFLNLRNDVPVFIFDWKGLIRWPGYKRFSKLKAFVASPFPKKIYAPNIHEITDSRYHNAFFKYCYSLGKPRTKNGCVVYVDEVSAIAKNDDDIPFYYMACITKGREKGISVYSSTQRPKKIPQIVLSESEHHYTFALQIRGDRQKIEDTTGIDEDDINKLISVEHKFYYSDAFGNVFGPTRLKIRKG